jgi:uncharacterized membrane protein
LAQDALAQDALAQDALEDALEDARDASSYANIDASAYDIRFVALLSISCSSTFS